MSDVVPVTRERLEQAIAASPTVVCANPGEYAEELMDHIDAQFRKELARPPVILPPQPEPDPEIAALTAITTALSGLTQDEAQRALEYAWSRFGKGDRDG